MDLPGWSKLYICWDSLSSICLDLTKIWWLLVTFSNLFCFPFWTFSQYVSLSSFTPLRKYLFNRCFFLFLSSYVYFFMLHNVNFLKYFNDFNIEIIFIWQVSTSNTKTDRSVLQQIATILSVGSSKSYKNRLKYLFYSKNYLTRRVTRK